MINKFPFLWRKKKKETSFNKHNFSRGVTLIEMMVVIVILGIASTITLINHQAFNNSIVLGSLAYDVALSIREAQVFGLAVREETVGSNFNIGYGVNFDGTSSTEFRLFADVNNNLRLDGGERILREFTIGRGMKILDFCAITIVGSIEKCKSDVLTHLNIVFQRPDPEAHFGTNISEEYRSARITVESPQGATREVEVLLTGQISVN